MKRFGLIIGLMSFFLSGCASVDINKNSELTEEPPMAADLGYVTELRQSEFVVGVGDTIQISVYRNEDLNRTATIDNSGKMMYPLIGDVEVAGKGLFNLRDEMQSRLSEYILSPQVSIHVSSIQSKRIIVLGEINKPGILILDSQLSILESIARAGGVTRDAKMDSIALIRRSSVNKPGIVSVDLKKAFTEGDVSQDMLLQHGDIVYVPAENIANVSWFLSHISRILSPIINFESGIILAPQAIDAIQGNTTRTAVSIPAQ